MDQTAKMMIQFKEEREDHVKILMLEKEKLKENYEYKLRSKDITYLKEIATLRTEFAVNRPFDTQGKDNKMYSTFKY